MPYRNLRDAFRHQDWLAYLIELVIVVLGITIAYQLNIYQQNLGEQKRKDALLENLRVENKQNYDEFFEYKQQFSERPLQLDQLIELLDNQELDSLAQNESLTNILLYVVATSVYYSIRESYLNTYLGNGSEMKNDTLTSEVIKLQSYYNDLNFIWKSIHEYRLNKINDFTEIAYDRTTKKYDFEALKNNVFLNRIYILSGMESEHAKVFREALTQMEIVNSLLSPQSPEENLLSQ